MKFEELDAKMRVYEESLDQCIVPGMYLIVRIDGRGFSHLTNDVCKFDRPFDERFSELMGDTVKHLMQCGFKVIYGYTQSDEISLLFAPDENAFSRKTRKFNSVLAGEASGLFSVKLGRPVAFDCRVIPLPSRELVLDYFMWRQEDAVRNALNGYVYWTLRKNGYSARKAGTVTKGKDAQWKNEFLLENGIDFGALPLWQLRGTGFYFETYAKQAVNKKTGENVEAIRRRIKADRELPSWQDYREYINKILNAN